MNHSFSRKQFLWTSFLMSLQITFLKSQSQPKAKGKVVVIGAGISGIAGAKLCLEAGFEVIVLEGRNRLGGRIHTIRDWGYAMDLGASWIHGRDNNPITKIAKEAKLATIPTDYENLEFWDKGESLSSLPKFQAERKFESIQEEMEEVAESLTSDISLGDFYKRFQSKIDPNIRSMVDWLFLTHESNLAQNLDRVSTISFFKEAETLSGDDLLFKEGYEGVPKFLAKGLNIQYDHHVTSVESKNKGVTVTTSKGEVNGDFCLVTVPLGVLQKGSIRFFPDWGEKKKKALSRLGMGLLNKMYAEFEEPFWDKTSVSLGIRPEKVDFRFFLNFLPISKKPTLVGFLPGDFGKQMETKNEFQWKEILVKRLSQEFGRTIPTPKKILMTKWSQDPFAFGSYSYFPIGSTGKDMLALGEPQDKVFFAGEHTIPKYYGYVHGGYLSGIRAANEMIQYKKI